MSETKVCVQCNQEKEITEFYTQKKTRKDGSFYIYYNPECKECTKNRSVNWKFSNLDKIKEIDSKYRKTKKGKIKNKKYNEKIRENGKRKDWEENNKHKLYEYGKRRNLHKSHIISNKEWAACKEYFNNSCAYCGLSVEEHRIIHRQDLHKEHVDHEGANDLSNCVPACRICNSQKHTFELSDWYSEENEKFSNERIENIHRWLNEDYKKFIKIN